jgi:hypothetical protein
MHVTPRLTGCWVRNIGASNVCFTVILNPNSGPGASPFPDANYSREIPKLTARPNVQTLGYVRTNYCNCDVAEVCEEVATYSGWASQPALAVHRIFLDETPNLFTENATQYLSTVGGAIKEAPAITGDGLVSSAMLIAGILLNSH